MAMSKVKSFLLLCVPLWVLGAGAPGAAKQNACPAQASATQQAAPSSADQHRPKLASQADIPEEAPEDELAPAALELNVANESPLIQVLYRATRETKEQPTLDRLAEAKKLIESGADLKATDPEGRTALH